MTSMERKSSRRLCSGGGYDVKEPTSFKKQNRQTQHSGLVGSIEEEVRREYDKPYLGTTFCVRQFPHRSQVHDRSSERVG